MSSLHPSQWQLESWHVGEHAGVDVATHVGSCSECRRFLDQLAVEREAFLRRGDPDEFVRTLRKRADAAAPLARWRLALPAAAAAALLALLVPRASESAPGDGATVSALQTAPRAFMPDDFAVKGLSPIAVIRKRGDEQVLLHERAGILPGDKLRLSFRLAEPRRIAAGILAGDGTWVSFFEETFGAGAHTPMTTLKVDANPSDGFVVFGDAEDVQAVLRGGYRPVQTIRLTWGGVP